MDTAIVFLRDTTEEAVVEYLNGLYPTQRDPWVSLVEGDPALYIHIDDWRDIQDELEPDERVTLINILGCEPAVCVVADLSFRHYGSREPERFALDILTNFNGLGKDEFTKHCWTLTELRVGHRVEGRRFFEPPMPSSLENDG